MIGVCMHHDAGNVHFDPLNLKNPVRNMVAAARLRLRETKFLDSYQVSLCLLALAQNLLRARVKAGRALIIVKVMAEAFAYTARHDCKHIFAPVAG